jgi:hypothetical protein
LSKGPPLRQARRRGRGAPERDRIFPLLLDGPFDKRSGGWGWWLGICRYRLDRVKSEKERGS